MIDLHSVMEIAYRWGQRCFGVKHMEDPQVRGLRFVEEAVELAQCLYVDKDKLHLLIDTVYAKPIGMISQEFGGAMITLLVLARQQEEDIEACTMAELIRILDKSPEHFAQRNQDKIDSGLS